MPVDPPPTEPPPTVYDPPVGCVCCLNPPTDPDPEVEIPTRNMYHLQFLYDFDSIDENSDCIQVTGNGESITYPGEGWTAIYSTFNGSHTGAYGAGHKVVGTAQFDQEFYEDFSDGNLPKVNLLFNDDGTTPGIAFTFTDELGPKGISWKAIAEDLQDATEAGTSADPFKIVEDHS